MNNQNYQQYIILATKFTSEFITITISNLALWFVPQRENYNYNVIFNFSDQSWNIKLLVLLNIITCFSCWCLYMLELYRDRWLIKNFDYSKRYNSIHLSKYKSDYAELFKMLKYLNNLYYYSYKCLCVIVLINIVISTVLVMKYNYNDYQTVTCLFVNFGSCCTKISCGLTVAQDSRLNEMGYSYFNTINLSYNRIDPTIKRHNSTSTPPISQISTPAPELPELISTQL